MGLFCEFHLNKNLILTHWSHDHTTLFTTLQNAVTLIRGSFSHVAADPCWQLSGGINVYEPLVLTVKPCFSEGSGWLFSKTFFLADASCSSVHSTLSLLTTEANETTPEKCFSGREKHLTIRRHFFFFIHDIQINLGNRDKMGLMMLNILSTNICKREI